MRKKNDNEIGVMLSENLEEHLEVIETIGKQIAESIGQPKSVRAVANACGKNPYPIIIPCHRVIKSDGALGGYSGKGGINKKRELLKKEQVFLKVSMVKSS